MKLGVVGLPNVGKSTLFNAITQAGAECANYPFCTIDPNVGRVAVPDQRLDVLAQMIVHGIGNDLVEVLADGADGGRNAHLIVIQDDDEFRA